LTVDKDIFSVFRTTIVECPVYRDQMRIRIDLTYIKVRTIDGDVGVLKCDWHEEFLLFGMRSHLRYMITK
jgi:hypothetical protein